MRDDALVIEGVPTRIFGDDDDGGAGTVLVGHGGGSTKDAGRFVSLSRRLAEGTGLSAVCIDAIDHGERKPSGEVPPGLPAGWHSRNVPGMVADWTAVASGLTPSLGPPVAYVGCSMGSIFGLPTVAAIPTITAAVFLVGGIPPMGGRSIFDDPALPGVLLDAAGQLSGRHVLFHNMTDDEVFPADGVRRLFDAVGASDKQLRFWDGGHDDWPEESVDQSIDFILRHTPAPG